MWTGSICFCNKKPQPLIDQYLMFSLHLVGKRHKAQKGLRPRWVDDREQKMCTNRSHSAWDLPTPHPV